MNNSLLSIGSRGLSTAQGALATVSHNIANASTDGYSRQEAVITSAGALLSTSGFFGQGAQIQSVRRSYDQFLTSAVQGAGATSSADKARADGLKSLDGLFSDPSLGIGAAVDDFIGAVGDLASRPADNVTRQAVLSRAQQLSQRITTVGGQVQDLVASADARLTSDAQSANQKLDEIHKLNDRIVALQGAGRSPNDLLDQRDAAVAALNQLVGVRTVAQGDGSLAVFAAGGSPLLVGSQQSRLETTPDAADPARMAVLLRTGAASQPLDAAALGGGSLAGTLQLRDQDLSAALNGIGRIATALGLAFNGQQAVGVDANGQAGQALFSVPDPGAISRAGNAGNGSLTATVTDLNALQPSDYDVRYDGSQYTVVRLLDGKSSVATSLPATIDGLSINLAGTPQAGDSWRLRPLAAAATGLAAKPLGPRDLATGYAARVQPASTNAGSGTAALTMVRPDAANASAVSITFTSATTFDVTGLASGPLTGQRFTPGQPVPASGDWNGWRLTLDGVPRAGDSFSVGATTTPAADNRNALALQRLGSLSLVAGGSLSQAYASLLGDVGSRVQAGQAAADVSSQLQAEAVDRQQQVAGVNLDEEAANLLRYQQTYQACARVVQTSQTLFDSLLSAVGR